MEYPKWMEQVCDRLYVGSRSNACDDFYVFRWNFDTLMFDPLHGGGAEDMRPYTAPEWRHVYDKAIANGGTSYGAWFDSVYAYIDARDDADDIGESLLPADMSISFMVGRWGMEFKLKEFGAERYGSKWAVVFRKSFGPARSEKGE